MVLNIDAWLFRGGDDIPPCEPEIKEDGSITCVSCSEHKCPYWLDYNNKSED